MLGPVRCSFCLSRLSYWPLCLPIYQHPFHQATAPVPLRRTSKYLTSRQGRYDITSITATFAAWFLPHRGSDSIQKPSSATPASRERNEERDNSYHLELVTAPKCATHRIFPLWSRARTDHEAHPSVGQQPETLDSSGVLNVTAL